MIVYRSLKAEFLEDAFKREVHEIVHERLRSSGLNVARSEIDAWKESLIYMARVLNDESIPDNAGVAIEFGIPQSAKRIDFIVSGTDADFAAKIVVIELKRWSSAKLTDMDGVVIARYRRGEAEVSHPAYQAWSYATLLTGFNEAVYEGGISIEPCAYLHNYKADQVITNEFYRYYLDKAPVFLKGDAEQARLQAFIREHVKYGDHAKAIFEIENGRIRPSKGLVDSLLRMMKGNQEFVLIDDQKVVYENALAFGKQASSDAKRVMIIEGGPGTGKSVLAVNLLASLSKQGLVCRYVSKNAAPRAVYEAKLTGQFRRTEISNLFSGSGVFSRTDKDAFDVLIVDEAHRLNEKSGLYQNLGDNQVKEIIGASKCAIFFIDEAQRVTLRDIGAINEIERWAKEFNATIARGKLASQFRCGGSEGYISWLNEVLQIDPRGTAINGRSFDQSEFDVRVFDSPVTLREAIVEKNRDRNSARMVAGYCWNWVSKADRRLFDIEFPDHGFSMRWNLVSDGSLWMIAKNSVNEVGCIHTSQGLEVDYIGVIIGPDLVVREGRVKTHPEARARTDKSLSGHRAHAQNDRATAMAAADTVIKNTYRALLSRGMKGCFIYCTDLETANYFRSHLMSKSAYQEAEPAVSDVLPFKRVAATPASGRLLNAVPLIPLKLAAGLPAAGNVGDLSTQEWAVLPSEFRTQPGLFVAQVIGESMNRRIRSGSWCLFKLNPVGTRQGRVVLAQHREIADPDTGGSFTVKVYGSEKVKDGDGSWRHTKVILSPDSDDEGFAALEFGPEAEDDLRIVAELISVL